MQRRAFRNLSAATLSARGVSELQLMKEFAELKLRQGNVSTGLGDPCNKTLTLAEAKKCKSGTELHGRKQQKLLIQAEQPRPIECAA